MTSEQLKSFITVADEKSFSTAAEKSFITKQALLKQINSLEEEIGVSLFIRGRLGVKLTQEGLIFYDGAKRMISEQQKLIAYCRMHAKEKDELRIGHIDHQKLLEPVTNRFAAEYPDIPMHIVIHPNPAGEYRVSHNIMDVGETFRNPKLADKIARLDNESVFTPLVQLPYVAVLSHSHPLAGQERIKLSSLKDYKLRYFPPLMLDSLLQRLEPYFCGCPENLCPVKNIDAQIAVAYACAESTDILVTCNPYVYFLENTVTVPIDFEDMMTYGIITSKTPTYAAKLYRELAVKMFRKYGASLLTDRNKTKNGEEK